MFRGQQTGEAKRWSGGFGNVSFAIRGEAAVAESGLLMGAEGPDPCVGAGQSADKIDLEAAGLGLWSSHGGRFNFHFPSRPLLAELFQASFHEQLVPRFATEGELIGRESRLLRGTILYLFAKPSLQFVREGSFAGGEDFIDI